jgi:hypothetical protein
MSATAVALTNCYRRSGRCATGVAVSQYPTGTQHPRGYVLAHSRGCKEIAPADLTRGGLCGIIRNMISDTLRQAIRASGLALLRIEIETGVHRASISRFVRGESWLRSDAVDKLCKHFGLELKPAARRPRKGARRG